MNTQRRFFSCMMIIGALQSFVFCSGVVVDETDDEVARYAEFNAQGRHNSEWDDSPVVANSSSAQTLDRQRYLENSVESRVYVGQAVAPVESNNVKIKHRFSNERKRFSTGSRSAIMQSVEGAVAKKPFTEMPGNRVRTHAIDMIGEVDLLNADHA